MENKLTKVDAAVDQTDWAIRLFLDHKAFVPAITLAGAAEEIVGQVLGENAAFNKIKEKLASASGLQEKVISQEHMNKTRNWLKHWKDLKDDETIVVDLESEAIQFILRALANLVRHDRLFSSEGTRFREWLAANRKDLCAP